MKVKNFISGKYSLVVLVLLLVCIGVSSYSLMFIQKNKDKLKNYAKLENEIDSLTNLNRQMIDRIQTSLDSINQFYQLYDKGEYELTYPDSILSWNQILQLDEYGKLDTSICECYIYELKDRTRDAVLFNELSKGNYDFYINSLTDAPNISPTFGVVTSEFGYRKHPIYRKSVFHSGLDIANDFGTPIYATSDGVVIKSSRDTNYGKYVIIKHAKGFETKYAHLSSSLVKAGTVVQAGDIIGEMGSTGLSTGNHLHYEVRRNDRLLNPNSFVNTSFRKIPKKNRMI